jgi:Ni,Fe-hydrogenase I large subunit
MEVGPLARVLVASAAGSAEITTPVDRALHTLGLGQDALYSSIGRILTRALESEIVVERLQTWLERPVAEHGFR